jgi:hypothetical protein
MFMHSVSRACCHRLVLVLDRVKQQAWQTDMVGWSNGCAPSTDRRWAESG